MGVSKKYTKLIKRYLKLITWINNIIICINNNNFLNVDNLFLISNAKNTIFQYCSLNTG